MIHYTCDACKRPLDPEEDDRYVVRLEVYAACDPLDLQEDDGDRDHLHEIQEILQRMEEAGEDHAGDDDYQQLRFDLCPECYKRFLKNPLGLDTSKLFDFSNN
jgi:hypothetical protein